MQVILLKILKGVLAAVLTERFVINLLMVLADWAVEKTSNDVDNKIVEELRKNLDTQSGYNVGNLYREVKERKLK